MADQKGSTLNLRGTPDRVNDYLYVWNGSSPYRTTVNNELGITGTPVGTTDVQTLTNKTLTSPTIAAPVINGTITGTYTLGGTVTLPATAATLSGTQTLTNKTLTNPTINSPTITNMSATQDAVTGFTTANTGTLYGIPVTLGKISGAVLTNNTIPYTALSTDSTWAWQSWTPTLTSVTIGNGSLSARYIQVGKSVEFSVRFVWGSTTTYTGQPSISLPVPSINWTTAYSKVIGNVMLLDVSAVSPNVGTLDWLTTTTAEINTINTAATYAVIGPIGNAVPFTWATGDIIDIQGKYEAA